MQIQTQTEQTRPYIKVEDDLKQVLNSCGRYSKNKHEKVLSLLRELENDFNIKVSKQFLKGLYENKTNQQKSNNLSFLLKKLNNQVMTNKQNKYFKEIVTKKFKTVVIDWSSNTRFKKNQGVGLFYSRNNMKTFNMIITSPTEINHKIQQYKEMIKRSRGFFGEYRVIDFFDNIFNKGL